MNQVDINRAPGPISLIIWTRVKGKNVYKVTQAVLLNIMTKH